MHIYTLLLKHTDMNANEPGLLYTEAHRDTSVL